MIPRWDRIVSFSPAHADPMCQHGVATRPRDGGMRCGNAATRRGDGGSRCVYTGVRLGDGVACLHKSDNWRIEGKWTESIGLDGEHSFVQNEVRYTAVTFFIQYFILYSTTITFLIHQLILCRTTVNWLRRWNFQEESDATWLRWTAWTWPRRWN